MKSIVKGQISSKKLTLEGSPKQNDILPKTQKRFGFERCEHIRIP